jgi:hypothetical protein
MNDSRAELVRRLDENTRRPAAHITWNRFLILFEKCMLTSRSWWLLCEVVVVFFFGFMYIQSYLNPSLMTHKPNDIPNNSSEPDIHWPELPLTFRYPFKSLYYEVKETADVVWVDEFVSQTVDFVNHCNPFR